MTRPEQGIWRCPLGGDLKGHRAFFVVGDVRVVYKIIDIKTTQLYDIGSLAKVYG
jgi:mRNA-degrading endonuclease YafQ of YafQ-DinJ toxin-antitoxin module